MTTVRDRLAIALDVADLHTAEQLAKEVAPWVGVAKIGLELYSASGPEAIARMRALDFQVFCDLKLHDIPTTVGRAARVLGRQGATYVNFHAAGGVEMMRAAVDGLAQGADEAGLVHPKPIAVTVLTSDQDASPFDARLAAAMDAGCEGVVCAMQEVQRVHAARSDFITIVPGSRFADSDRNDQARFDTPDAAVRAGADILVLGRVITATPDHRAAAQRVFDAVTNATSTSD
jgi:orotidine-5'-phosphate decarboxylase